ncbi:MAG TPA: hypothetical protein VMU20_02785 [Candidatus Dormibacteraeota bacterium]|jgi:hypothetical protein|nr:hypothetical protein [Candidatus Dormibacteraeota bacterium]
MALAIYFHPEKMSSAQYDEAIRRLEAAGAGRPAGRLHHSCFGTGDSMMVYDVWESEEAFNAFGATLMPILESMNLDPGTPDVMPIHNVIQ